MYGRAVRDAYKKLRETTYAKITSRLTSALPILSLLQYILSSCVDQLRGSGVSKAMLLAIAGEIQLCFRALSVNNFLTTFVIRYTVWQLFLRYNP